MAAARTGDVHARGPTLSPQALAASLGVRERVLLFCVASITDWQKAAIPAETVSAVVVRGLIMRNARGELELTDRGRATLRVLLPD